jgi:hypothetical protein
VNRVTRVRSLGTIGLPGVRALVERSTAASLPGVSPRKFYEEIANRIDQPALGVFIGFEDEQPQTLVVALLPTSCMMLHAQIVAAYNQGSKGLAEKVAARVREWIVAAGHHQAAAINIRRPDGVFSRGLRYFGRPERLGSVILFHFA